MDIKICRNCGIEFKKPPNTSYKRWSGRSSCSAKCGQANKVTPWLEKYKFTKGQTSGKNNPNWKGNKVGYDSLHNYISRHYGKARQCDKCGSTDRYMYHWSNKTGKYLRDREDWWRLCVPCHKKFDLGRLSTDPIV